MEQTKNTTAAERRIARRQQLAEALNTAAKAVEAIGASGDFIREAATELLIGNTEILLAQPWATDGKPGQVQVLIGGRVQWVDPVPLPAVVRVVKDPPTIDDAMVERAVDGWEQFWNDFTGHRGVLAHRAAMRHALEQALGVRS